MALIKCRECGQSISSSANKCPHCGAFAPSQTNWILYLVVAWLIIGALAFLFFTRQGA